MYLLYVDIQLYIKDNKYYFDDPNIIDLNNIEKGYSNKLSYEIGLKLDLSFYLPIY